MVLINIMKAKDHLIILRLRIQEILQLKIVLHISHSLSATPTYRWKLTNKLMRGLLKVCQQMLQEHKMLALWSWVSQLQQDLSEKSTRIKIQELKPLLMVIMPISLSHLISSFKRICLFIMPRILLLINFNLLTLQQNKLIIKLIWGILQLILVLS